MAYRNKENDYIYSSGCRLELRSHRPPLPFGDRAYKANRPKSLPPGSEKSENQQDFVFRCVPLTTEPPSHDERLEIIIQKKVSSGRSHGAQTFICKIADEERKIRFVKIYDPLYYLWDDEFGNRNNVTIMADKDYSREAATYNFLSQKGQNGTLAPHYYGSWTISLIGPQGKRRPVRLILLEYFPAPSLFQEYYPRAKTPFGTGDPVPPNRATSTPAGFEDFEGFRLEVYGCLLEIIARQLHNEVYQGDYAPRNVLAVSEKSENGNGKIRLKRVVLVDYNNSIVFPLSNLPIPAPEQLPYNPLRKYWDGWLYDFSGWIPREWFGNEDLHRGWLYRRFGSTERRKEYMPLPPDFLQTLELWRKSRGKEHD